MWEQFLAQPDCRAVSGTTPTILYFPRYWRNDRTIEEKRAELAAWSEVLRQPNGQATILRLMLDGLAKEVHSRGKRLRRFARLRQPLGRIRRRFARLWT
jgi:hypothetical protein